MRLRIRIRKRRHKRPVRKEMLCEHNMPDCVGRFWSIRKSISGSTDTFMDRITVFMVTGKWLAGIPIGLNRLFTGVSCGAYAGAKATARRDGAAGCRIVLTWVWSAAWSRWSQACTVS